MPRAPGSCEQSTNWTASEIDGCRGLTVNSATGCACARTEFLLSSKWEQGSRECSQVANRDRFAGKMDYRFLGPLEVRAGGAVLPLGGQKQRGVLAVLLLNANRVVSMDRLVDDVWGESAPRTVNAYVQNCVSRLRVVLGRDAIETHPGGYLLRVQADEVDALRFARAVDEARRLEAPERVASLGDALALWRGPPLVEFAFEPFAQPEIARLEELRLEAGGRGVGGPPRPRLARGAPAPPQGVASRA